MMNVDHPRIGAIALKVIPRCAPIAKNATDTLDYAWMWACPWDELLERFHQEAPVLVRAYKSAEQRNDAIGLSNVVARMKRLNDTLEARLSIEDPDAYDAILREEIEQKELRAMADRFQRARLSEMKASVDAIREDARRHELRGITERWKTIPSRDLPERFDPLVKFALRKLGLYPSQRPTIKLTGVGDPLLGGVLQKNAGTYDPSTEEIRVRSDLPDDRIESTLLHELVHHYCRLNGVPDPESYVLAEERTLFAAWENERDAERWAA